MKELMEKGKKTTFDYFGQVEKLIYDKNNETNLGSNPTNFFFRCKRIIGHRHLVVSSFNKNFQA